MTRRSYTNDRNMGDGPEGVTRKSAAKAKPASKAASTVYVKSGKKTRKELKQEAAQKEEKKRQKEAQKPQNIKMAGSLEAKKDKNKKEIRKWRKRWWVAIAIGVICIVISVFNVANLNTYYIVFMVLAYAAIIVALFIEFGKIRRLKKLEEQGGGSVKKSPKQLKHELEQARLEEERRAAKKSNSKIRAIKKKISRKNDVAEDLPMKE